METLAKCHKGRVGGRGGGNHVTVPNIHSSVGKTGVVCGEENCHSALFENADIIRYSL